MLRLVVPTATLPFGPQSAPDAALLLCWEARDLSYDAALPLGLRQRCWRASQDLWLSPHCDPQAAAGLALGLRDLMRQSDFQCSAAPRLQALLAQEPAQLHRVARCTPAQLRRWMAALLPRLEAVASGPSCRRAIGSPHDPASAAILR